ncbi:shikimate dehydrogenase [Prolixibacteraceae bacterium JC049]|nr:shikimate dehydrogenase [Prolixibacteraceae bacterium JC049]
MNRYGLIGFPLTHSFSKKFFTEKFQVEKIDAEYLNFEIENINTISEILESTDNLKGLNVTIPHKEAVMPLLTNLNDAAQAIGAVNTIKVNQVTGETTGYNTDVYGFMESIKPLIKAHHKSALVLGTGGASKAVVWALNHMGITTQLVSRRSTETTLAYEELTEELMQQYSVVVNTTPLGTYPKEETFPAIPYQYLTKDHLLYDLVYNPSVTTFMKKGIEQGATVKNGHDMLELQALKAWEIWNE